MATVKDVRKFFEEGDSGRKVTVAELRALSPEDRQEIKALVEKELA